MVISSTVRICFKTFSTKKNLKHVHWQSDMFFDTNASWCDFLLFCSGLLWIDQQRWYLISRFEFIIIFQFNRLWLVCVWGGGGGGGSGACGAGNLGVIVVRKCEPVFRNQIHSYTWPLKKRTHSYILNQKRNFRETSVGLFPHMCILTVFIRICYCTII